MRTNSCLAAIALPLSVLLLSTAQEASASVLAQQCDEQSAAILSSFANDQERVTQMLGLESACAGTGIYEARLAQLYSETRDFAEGEAVAEQALLLESPYENEILVALVHLALQQREDEQAALHVTELATKYPDWPRSMVTAARVLQIAFAHEAAIALLESANEIEESGEAYLFLSGLLYSNGEYDEALEVREKALTLDPSLMRFTEYVAVAVLALIELDREDEGRQLLDQHLELLPHAQQSSFVQFLEEKLSGRLDSPQERGIVTSAPRADAPPPVDPDAPRSSEEIEYVFRHNGSAIFALYNRALRADPALEGRVVLRVTIHSDGHVERCEIAESTLPDQQLMDRLCERVLRFEFAPLNGGQSITVTKPIDFFPT